MNKIYLKFAQIISITFVSLCLPGCVVEILGAGVGGAMWVGDKIHEAYNSITAPKSIQDIAASFVIGKTTKDEIRNVLGKPIISRQDLDIEIYYDDRDGPVYLLVNYKNNTLSDYDIGSSEVIKTGYVFFNTITHGLYIPWEYVENFIAEEGKIDRPEDKGSCDVFIASKNAGSIFLNYKYLGCAFCNDCFFYQRIQKGTYNVKACDNSYNRDPYTSACSENYQFECSEGEDAYLNVDIFKSSSSSEKYELNLLKNKYPSSWIDYHNL